VKKLDATAHAAKQAAAEHALAGIESGMTLGLGTGSTTARLIAAIGRRIAADGWRLRGVPTSFSAAALGRSAGIRIVTLADVDRIDVAFDGADEFDAAGHLVKGGGAAHTQEKVVDGFADRFVVLVDDSKRVDVLGRAFPVPVEVLPFALPAVQRRLSGMGARSQLRTGTGKDGPVVTDHGNLVLDVYLEGGALDPEATSRLLHEIPGVVEHGLFVHLAHEIVIGHRNDASVEVVQPPRRK
jgi:ribose 5-phosphate isomerase A